MVLQAGGPVAVWGWADPGTGVTAAFVDEKGVTRGQTTLQANEKGRWKGSLPALPAGLQGRLVVTSGEQEKIVVPDVATGDVWLGGGQSNMSYKVAAANVAAETLAEAKALAAEVRPAVRFFMTTSKAADEPRDDVEGEWKVADADSIGNCSAVAWYFGLALHKKLKTPVGLIVSAVGGTKVEAWMPRRDLDATSIAGGIWKRHEEALSSSSPDMIARHRSTLAAWEAANPTPELRTKNGSSRPRDLYLPDDKNVPCRLYNGRIAGLAPYAVKGIIWFQADGNNAHPEEYSELIQALIKAWRSQWNAELPFYYVEMNNMHELQKKAQDDRPLAEIREAQNGALRQPRPGVVASIDLGIAENAHFPVKKPVGDRLANLVLSEVYQLPVGEVNSPAFAGYKMDGNRIRLYFRHADGLRSREGDVRGFALKNPGGDWVWADGEVEGNDLLVWNAQVPSPQGLRYGWADNPIISIENGAGLPLRPFRIDLKKSN
jgi:sialate O-acetylesterase